MTYYAALLPRRGRILRRTLSFRLSVCLSVCPSVPCLFTLEPSSLRAHIQNRKTSVFGYRPASTLRTCGIFCFVYICGPHTVGRSAAQACFECCCTVYATMSECTPHTFVCGVYFHYWRRTASGRQPVLQNVYRTVARAKRWGGQCN